MAARDDLPHQDFFLRPTGLALLILGLTAIRAYVAANTHFVEDEAYYRIWGLYPALSYYDHPPMIGWWIAAGQAIFGDTVLAVRALVIASGVIGSLALWRTSALLFGPRTAGWSVLFLNTTILVGVGGILATPDAPSVLFWGLALWALAELSASRNPVWWLVVGLMAGLGLLSKYSVLFLGAGIVLWLIWVPEARRWWRCWQLWAGGAIAMLLFLPVLYWNHLHDWASFAKQFGRAGGTGFTAKYIFEFIFGLIGLFNPMLSLVALAGSTWLWKRLVVRENAASLLMLTVLPFMIYLLYHSLHARVQGNWPAPLYPAFAMMAAVFVVDRSGYWEPWLRWTKYGVALGLMASAGSQLHALHPLTGEIGRADPTAQMRGWPEIGDRLRGIARRDGAAFVATSSYGLNGQLDFLLKDDLPVIQLTERIRYVMQPEPDPALFERGGLYVAEARRDKADNLEAVFARVEKLAELPRSVDGKELESLVVYRLGEPLGPVVGQID
ncbi:MAG: glycosyltransferase family 39 protein [Roseibium sp.]